MSEIKVDTLTGKTTAGDITITNGTTTQKLQDGVVSTYSLYDQQNTAIDISLNISSVTDVSTGNYALNFSNNYATTKEYVVMASAQSWFDNGGSDNSILYEETSHNGWKNYSRHPRTQHRRFSGYINMW
jgi:hypothetical protein